MLLIIGLGNPGREYARTRHNAGFMALDIIADKAGINIDRKGFRSVYGEGHIGNEKVILAKPQTYMNDSGWAAVDLINWFKPEHKNVLVIFDDADLPLGAIRIRRNGSAGTHNGMRSIIAQLGYDDFPRIRIGIGKAEHDLVNHVLGVPDDEDFKLLKKAFDDASEAAALIARGDFSKAQEQYNYKPPKKPRQPKKTADETAAAGENSENGEKTADKEQAADKEQTDDREQAAIAGNADGTEAAGKSVSTVSAE